MDWEEVLKIGGAVLASLGGASGIIILFLKASANRIAERLSAKYQIKLDKELETYKAVLDNKVYMSKLKYDTELSVYRSLSTAFFDMVKAVNALIPYGLAKVPANEEDRRNLDEEHYQVAATSLGIARDTLYENYPFVIKAFRDKYEEMLRLTVMQLSAFDKRWDRLYLAPQEEKESLSIEDYNRSKEIQDIYIELSKAIGEHICSLGAINMEENQNG